MELKALTSPTNPRILQASKLARSGAFRRQAGKTLLEGRKVIEDALRERLPIESVFVSQDFVRSYPHWLREHMPEETSLYVVPNPILKKISTLETPEGVLALCCLKPRNLNDLFIKRWGVVLDGVQEPGNAGAIARAALAFGAEGIVFTSGSVDPLHPRTIRGSMGALLSLPFATADTRSLTEWIQRNGFALIGTHPRRGVMVANTEFQPPFLVAFGSEGHGISRALEEMIHTHLCIPTQGVESLPVVVAAGIIFYEIAMKHIKTASS